MMLVEVQWQGRSCARETVITLPERELLAIKTRAQLLAHPLEFFAYFETCVAITTDVSTAITITSVVNDANAPVALAKQLVLWNSV